MKEIPILFSGEMVRGILEGRKTQTRRVVKPQPQLISGRFEFSGNQEDAWPEPQVWLALTPSGKFGLNRPPYYRCPYGAPGYQLWVRETWCQYIDVMSGKREDVRLAYRATDEMQFPMKWRPSIHMPRWASRITLEVTRVRVERLQEISEEDLKAEGLALPSPYIGVGFGGEVIESEHIDKDPWHWFAELWDSLNAKRGYGWEANPWVWVIEYKRVEE